MNCFGQGGPVKRSHQRANPRSDQGVVAMGVDDVEAAEVLFTVAEGQLPYPKPGAKWVCRAGRMDSSNLVASIRWPFIGCEDRHVVAALRQSIGQSVGYIGHAACLGAVR